MKTEKKYNILVTGHRGLLVGEIVKELKKQNYKNIFFIPKKKLDLRDAKKVLDYFKQIKLGIKNKFDLKSGIEKCY